MLLLAYQLLYLVYRAVDPDPNNGSLHSVNRLGWQVSTSILEICVVPCIGTWLETMMEGGVGMFVDSHNDSGLLYGSFDPPPI